MFDDDVFEESNYARIVEQRDEQRGFQNTDKIVRPTKLVIVCREIH